MEMLLLDVCALENDNMCHGIKNVKDVIVDVGGCGAYNTEYEDFRRVIPPLLKRMSREPDTDALRSLYRLCDKRNRHNR